VILEPPNRSELPLSDDSPLVHDLANAHACLSPAEAVSSAVAAEIERLGAVLAVPLHLGEKLLGILMLGEKRSGEPYGQEDLDLLGMLAQSAALALENARLHEERLEMLRQQFVQAAEVQEAERRRIARELHDGVGPSLASLNLQLLTLRKQLQPTGPELAAEIEGLAGQAQANLRDIRRLIYDLRPAVLDELGLAAALREYAQRYQREQHLSLTLEIADGSPRFPDPLEAALYRIVQEALANAAKHAQATTVRVELGYDGQTVRLSIADDGCGFVPSAPLAGSHLGLWSIRKRVEQFGGTFDIRSEPGHGTRLEIQIPHSAGIGTLQARRA
jgi:signal transduction histidine kinase